MTAHGAMISLQKTIHHILHSSRISLVPPSPEIIQLAYNELQPLRKILQRLDSTRKSKSRKKVNALDGRIKEAIWKFEDLLEFLLSDQIISQFESPRYRLKSRRKFNIRVRGKEESHTSQFRSSVGGGERDVFLFSIDLQRLQDEVGSFIQTLKVMKKEYIYEVENMPEDDDDEYISSSRAKFGGMKSKMIGLSDQFQQFKNHLIRGYGRRRVYALVGMPGVGKTALAVKIFEDESILSYFECCAWVTVGRKLQFNQVSRGILVQLDPNMHGIAEGDEKMGDYLKERLEGKKCLIVLDDVWEAEVLESFICSLPDINVGTIKILLTARDRKVIEGFCQSYERDVIVVRLMNVEESKDLLCEKVFGEEICPPQLEKAATKIAKNCEGLPLTIVTVADLLSQAQNTDPEYWNDVAENRNSVFTDAYIEISKVLFPSYDYLPQHLKMFLLYLGAFPQDYEIPLSKIINMLTAEGWFVHTNKILLAAVSECVNELARWQNLVMFKQKSIYWYVKLESYTFKTCRLHSSWQHLCRGEARKNKFFHVLNKLVDVLEQAIKGQRCLCLHNNLLFGIKEFCNSVRCDCASSTRSVLFFGPYHQYPTPIDVGFKLLRELDALKLRFYTFPTEILTLVQLKYLALTCSGELPTAISKLFNLKILIIHPHMNIQVCRAQSYIPIQIWDMQKLEHIEVLGKSLVAPDDVVTLKKVSTLVGVNANICTILKLFKRIPSIRKLGVQIELTPYDDRSDLLSCFRCISTLGRLETLKCSITNPVVKYGYAVPATPSSLFLPRGLEKLHLSGMGFPWEYMDVIGSLPSLQVLKLRSYAFRGSKWETKGRGFSSLGFLLIEDSDLVQWKPGHGSFSRLCYLSMKHCYKLQELHWPSHFKNGKIELVDCNPLAFACARQLQPKYGNNLSVSASSSYHGKPVTIELRRLVLQLNL